MCRRDAYTIRLRAMRYAVTSIGADFEIATVAYQILW